MVDPVIRVTREVRVPVDDSAVRVIPAEWTGSIDEAGAIVAADAGAIDPDYGDGKDVIAWAKRRKKRPSPFHPVPPAPDAPPAPAPVPSGPDEPLAPAGGPAAPASAGDDGGKASSAGEGDKTLV